MHPDKVSEVLQVVLQQFSDTWDVKTLCSLLQASTGCRKAVFVSGASCAVPAAILQAAAPGTGLDLTRLAGFCAWLPGHASLLHELVLRGGPQEAPSAPAEQLLSLALQLCAQQATAGQQQQVGATGLIRPLQQLQLRCLDTELGLQPAALAALAAVSSLTALVCRGSHSAAASGCLRQLASLKRLVLTGTRPLQSLPPAAQAALTQLHGLEQLRCLVTVPPAFLRHLPKQLQQLTVVPSKRPERGQVIVDLSGLTALHSLNLYVSGGLSEGTVLPAGLTALKVSTNGPVHAHPALLELQELSLDERGVQHALLQQVAAMPALRRLTVTCHNMAKPGRLTAQHASGIASAVASATSITRLCLSRWDGPVEPHPDDSIQLLHDCTRQLQQLRDLTVAGFKVEPSDMLKLTVLSGLTRLALQKCPALGDTAAAALACKLTGLHVLVLQTCGLTSPVLWPAFASCTGLRELDLRHNDSLGIADETLVLLTSLTRLTSLAVPCRHLSAEVVRQFKAGMPQLKVFAGGDIAV